MRFELRWPYDVVAARGAERAPRQFRARERALAGCALGALGALSSHAVVGPTAFRGYRVWQPFRGPRPVLQISSGSISDERHRA